MHKKFYIKDENNFDVYINVEVSFKITKKYQLFKNDYILSNFAIEDY